MIGGVTCHITCHLSGVPHLHVNRPLRRKESGRSLATKSTFNVQILASHQLRYINTIGCFGGDVAVHMRKIDDPGCKVIYFIVDAYMERWVVVTKLDPCVEVTHFRC